MAAAPIHDDFRFEYDQVQRARLRRRVQWYAGVLIALRLISLLVMTLNVLSQEQVQTQSIALLVSFGSSAFAIFAYGWVFVDAWQTDRPRQAQLRVLRWVLIATTILSTLVSLLVAYLISPVEQDPSQLGVWSSWRNALLFAGLQMFTVFQVHFIACVFLPWSPRESVRPMFPVLGLTTGCLLVLAFLVGFPGSKPTAPWITIPAALILSIGCVAALLPGIAVSWWKSSRFARDFLMQHLRRGYTDIRREMTDAQRIHENLFPRPEQRGGLQLDYRYAPMRAIGGDYLYAKFINGQLLGALRTGELPDGTGTQPPDIEPCELVVVILDVCGHGISAALTVNRLHGELERQLAEQPNITPAELLCALNRYVYLTLAHHSIFVTAVAFRVSESTDRLHYASAGHPPAIVLRPDAPAELLAPTAMVLGVDRDLMVEAQNASVPFRPGDTLIAYTDGATEARNALGEMLSTNGLSDLAQASVGASKPQPAPRPTPQTAPPHSPGVCTRLMSAINQHRFGPPTDDTLIVHVCRASTPASTPPHAPAPRPIPATQTAGA